MNKRWLDAKYQQARMHLEVAYAISRHHSELANVYGSFYGWHGPAISGVVRDHWPKEAKAELRALCDRMNAASDAAEAAMPERIANKTKLEFRRAVRNRVGSGIYL